MNINHITHDEYRNINVVSLYKNTLPYKGKILTFAKHNVFDDQIIVYSHRVMKQIGILEKDCLYHGIGDYSVILKFSPSFSKEMIYYKSIYHDGNKLLNFNMVEAEIIKIVYRFLTTFI